jgi:hypothetical protein
MSPLGIHLTLWVGPVIPAPAAPLLIEALQSVEVTHSDEQRSGFQITFKLDGSDPLDLLALLSLQTFNRIVLMVTFNAIPHLLMDGVITHHQLSPGNEPGDSTLTVTGEDVSVMMDLEEKSAQHPALDETLIAKKLIAGYLVYGLDPQVIPPPLLDLPNPMERVPVQQGTDLQYLKQMAQRYGYVFYVTPGPAPLTNTAYWGPPVRAGRPQSALSVNLGPDTNVSSIHFQNNALTPTHVSGYIHDRLTNQSLPVETFASLRPPLAVMPALLANLPHVRTTQFRQGGLNVMQAYARAQGMTEAAGDAITATGELDALRYGGLLEARRVVGVRGAGYFYDGLWYVKSVTHTLSQGEYKQRFTLAREGLGSTTPVVIP